LYFFKGVENSISSSNNSNNDNYNLASLASSSYTMTDDEKFSKSYSANNTNSIKELFHCETITLIQNISKFIQLLNDHNRKLDNELKDIILSVNRFIELIENSTQQDDESAAKVNELVSQLENYMSLIIKEIKLNKLDNVVKASLELANTAKEIFLTIVKQN
jgi:hypothetical protein